MKQRRRIIILAITLTFLSSGRSALAITAADLNALDNNTIYYIDGDKGVACTAASPGSTATTLSAIVPAPYHDIFAAAAAAAGADPALLATIFYVENGHGQFPEPPPPYGTGKAWPTSGSGAQGPFQFLPGTWTQYGQGGNVQDLKDAAGAAARFIVALGGKAGIPVGDKSNPRAQTPSVAYVLAAYNAGPAGNFGNPQTVQYVQLGLNQYANFAAPTGTAAAAANVAANPTGTSTTGGAVIVLDPGHSGTAKKVTDPTTGIIDYDYPNLPEDKEVMDVANLVKAKLTSDGYNVVMTKNDISQYVSLRERADIATNAKAALAVSIHDDRGQSFSTWGQVYTQKVGLYRSTLAGVKVPFTDATVAAASAAAGSTMVAERSAAEGRAVSNTDANFDSRTGFSPGNIPDVMLFTKVPWIYNEVGANDAGGLTAAHKQAYATGIINGIEKAVSKTGTGVSASASSDPCSASNLGNGSGAGIVTIAKGQIGTYEWTSASDNSAGNCNCGGGIQDGGKTVDSYTQNHAEFWCADFVSWVYFKNGTPLTGGSNPSWRIAGAAAIANYMKSKGVWIENGPTAADPTPGMIVYFNESHTGAIGGANDHIGIVESVNGSTLTTIEGNSGNKVQENTYTNFKNNSVTIVGFGGLK